MKCCLCLHSVKRGIAAMVQRDMIELFENVLLLGKAISKEIMSEILKLNLSISQKSSI